MEGTLDRLQLTGVLDGFRASRRSGVLHLARDGATKRVYFKDGRVVYANSDLGEDRLGELIVRSGRLKREELDLACKVREASQLRLGRTLVDLGYMSDGELDGHIKGQVEVIIRSVICWESGSFRTELNERPVDEDLQRSDISVENVVLDALRTIEDVESIRAGIGDLNGTLRFAKDSSWIDANLRLTPEEGFLLSRVDGAATALEIAQLSPMGENDTLRMICALVVAGVLVVERTSRLQVEAPPGVTRTSEPAPEPPRLETVKKDVEPELSPEAKQFRDDMYAKHATAHEVTYYKLLEVAPNASTDEIKAGYFKFARKLHPDHRAGLKIRDEDGVLADLYLAIKAAYEVLSSETERRRYDFSLEKLQMQKRSTVAVSEQATGKDDPASNDPVRTFDAKQMARLHYGNGQKYYAQENYHEAIAEFQDAVRLDGSNANYHRLLGFALAKNPRWRRRAEEHLLKVLESEHFDTDTMLALGELYEEGGMDTRARKMYEEALGMDPDNVRALEKLASTPRTTAMERLRGVLHRKKKV
ncbi:MAG: DUF4388 domain-containing protein [Acidobacteria bacterium]|nr:MAG: DUF4388 domain-containing protein [Acidobacteriota bacterium]